MANNKFKELEGHARKDADLIRKEVNSIDIAYSGGNCIYGYFNNDHNDNPSMWFEVDGTEVALLSQIGYALTVLQSKKQVVAYLAKNEQNGYKISYFEI